ncbi:MAG: UPF0175 family protein [Planctomycetaceae bacterium]|nr:UPF0175 family protein [Planctomycetaceae bacterium]
MPLMVPDDVLSVAHLTERAAQLEIACRFFQSGRLTLSQAADWVGMSRSGFECELIDRGIPVYTLTEEELERDVETLRRIGPKK